MREHHPSTNDRQAPGTSEFRAVAEEAWDLSAHALHAARDWFTGRRTPEMRERNPGDMRQRGASSSWQDTHEHEGRYGRYGRGRFTQASTRGTAWDRDEQTRGESRFGSDEAFRAGERERGHGAGRAAGYGAYGEREGGRDYAAPRGYAYEDEDFDSAAWPRTGRRDYGPGGYGSGPSFERGPGAYGYGQGEYDERYEPGYTAQDRAGSRGQGSAYGGSDRFARGAGERDFNDRWENAYRGEGYESAAYGGGAAGYASPQRQGYGREPVTGLGRRGLGPKNYTRSDERIREDVSERLSDDDQLDASDIEVQVNQGTVTLAGTVQARWEKHRAEDIADGCSGVRDVHNQIRVGAASTQASSMSPQSAGTSVGSGVGATRESVQGGDAPLSGGASPASRHS